MVSGRGLYRTAVLSEAWAKLRDWASVAGRGRLLLSGSVAHASLKTAVQKLRRFNFIPDHNDPALPTSTT